MPSKKKSKPSFQVPEELQTAPQAGWVYRSDKEAPAKEAKSARKSSAGGKAAPKGKPAVETAPVPAAAAPAPRVTEAKPKPAAPAAKKKDRSSKSSNGVLDLTAKTLSAGVSTAGSLMLMTTRIMVAPLKLGKRFLGL
jgi:hypothetical protein